MLKVAGVSQLEFEKIKKHAEQLHVECDFIYEDDLKGSVRDLFIKQEKVGQVLMDSAVLLFSQVSRDELVQLVKLLQQDVEFDGAIGVVNENNAQWTLHHLLQELEREHQFYALLDEIQWRMKELEGLELANLSDDHKKELMDAYLFLQNPVEETKAQYHLSKLNELIELLYKLK
ncbi:MAG: DUF3783 domain-containing protein [Anaerorhabdus sp.]